MSLAEHLRNLSVRRTPEGTVAAALEAACRLLPSQGAALLLREGDTLRYSAEEGVGPLWRGRSLPMDHSAPWTVLRTGQPLFVGDALADPHAARYRPTFVRSFAKVPLSPGEPVGVFAAYWDAPRRSADLDLLQILAESLGVHLERLKLRETDSRFRLLFGSRLVGIVFWDAQGRVIDANGTFLSIAGYTHQELAAGLLKWDQVAASSAPSERELRRRDGSAVPILVGGASLEGSDGGVSLVLDLTDRKRLEGDLAQSQKMEGMGRLAGGIAHDFNNLLTSIIGYAEMAIQAAPPGSSGRPALGEIRNAALRAADLTRQLLAFSRKQVLQPRVFDLGDIVRKFGNLLRRTLGEHIDLALHVGPGLHRVKADIGQIEQVILNLATNARDAMPTGGRLDLTVTLADSAPGIELPPGGYVRLTLCDTGQGMDPDTLGHLFEPFFTTKEVGRGTGLGLPTVYGIVRQSGAYISVRSAVGQGTTFDILFPEAVGEVETAGRDVSARKATGTETILLVEDEESVRKLSQALLESLGYRVITASNGQDALRLARGHERELDLLVTDVVMPKLGGKALADSLRERNPDLKVLYVSGYTKEFLSQQGILGQGTSFMEKPFTPQTLGEKVRRVIDRKGDSPSRGLPAPYFNP